MSNYREYTAERIQLAVRECLSRRELAALQHAEIDVVQDLADRMCVMLDTYIYGMTKEKISIHERWPETWWDAVKERWFPAWAKRRWPARFKEINVEQKIFLAVCPHIHEPKQTRHMQWMASKYDPAALAPDRWTP